MPSSEVRLPPLARIILRILLPRHEHHSLIGCYEADYHRVRRLEGRRAADRWLRWQIGRAAPVLIRNTIGGELIMVVNYIKTAIRNIHRHKGYAFINIAGLSIGMACCLLIFLWVNFEMSYDRFHEHREEISRVVVKWPMAGGIGWSWRTPPPLADALREEIPEIRDAVHFYTIEGILVEQGEIRFKETIGFSNNHLFNIFTLPLRLGQRESLLEDPQSLAISTSTAEKYFGQEDPLGRTLVVDDDLTFRVAAVMEDIPVHSCLHCPILIPFRHLEAVSGMGNLESWGDFGYNTFVQLEKTADPAAVNTKLKDYLALKWERPDDQTGLHLEPLARMHLYDLGGGGPIVFVWIFSAIAGAVLLIACFNFMNLATARAATRALEIGIRKMAGADRRRLIQQFLSESLVMTLIALGFALAMTGLLAPTLARLAEMPDGARLLYPAMIPAMLLIAVFTGLAAGAYPAFALSAFQPAAVMKRDLKSGSSLLRRTLVVFQFSVSVILLIGMLIISRQTDYMSRRPLGFSKHHVIYVPMNDDLLKSIDPARNELLRHPGIRSAGACSNYLGRGAMWRTTGVTWEGKDQEDGFNLSLMYVDHDFAETFQLNMAAGRFFSREFEGDRANFIINRTAAREMGVDNALNMPISVAGQEGRIIGIVEDFHFSPLRTAIRPLCLILQPDYFRFMAVRIDATDIPTTLGVIREVFKRFSPRYPFEYRFLDEVLEESYRAELRSRRLLRVFVLLAGFISCLGLFGLAAFTAQKRTKEIGVRKVLGASDSGIFLLLSRSFLRWVMAANAIAWPVAYLIMTRWLRSFAYRTPLGWTSFAAAGLLSLGLALLTVSGQSIRVARSNPVDSLRNE